ncbi:MAG: hypothetical protein IPG71_08750 [bacterium]|nr:hypothetical protein [bacterium]
MEISATRQLVPLQKPAENPESPKELKKAVEGFEILFAHQLLETMQKDLAGESLFAEGVESNTFGAMAQWDLAKKLAESIDLGLEEQLLMQVTAHKEAK